MPKPEIQAVIEAFRKQLLNLEVGAAGEMVQAYGQIWRRLSDKLNALLEEAAAKGLSLAKVQRSQRYQELLVQTKAEIERFAQLANNRIALGQAASVDLSLKGTHAIVNASLPPGIDLTLLKNINLGWNALPTDALAAFIGVAGDGKPLMRLLAPLGVDVQQGVRESIAEGIGLGYSPRKTARLVRERTGMGLTRSLTISRTETLRAYRNATQAQYQANANIIKGYRRHSARDDRVCPACLALDNKFYENNDDPQIHVNCRCALVPETVTYQDLGLNVPEPKQPPTAQEWFEGQSESTQREMLGNARFEAWQAGEIDFSDMVKIDHSDTWGDSAVVKPLREAQ